MTALLEMQNGLACIRRELEYFDSLVIRQLLIDLYVNFFKFLTNTLSLLSSNEHSRFKASFSNSFYNKDVEKLVKNASQIEQRIRLENQHITQGKLRDVNMKLNLMMDAMDSRNGNIEFIHSKLGELANALQSQMFSGSQVASTSSAAEQPSEEGKLPNQTHDPPTSKLANDLFFLFNHRIGPQSTNRNL